MSNISAKVNELLLTYRIYIVELHAAFIDCLLKAVIIGIVYANDVRIL